MRKLAEDQVVLMARIMIRHKETNMLKTCSTRIQLAKTKMLVIFLKANLTIKTVEKLLLTQILDRGSLILNLWDRMLKTWYLQGSIRKFCNSIATP